MSSLLAEMFNAKIGDFIDLLEVYFEQWTKRARTLIKPVKSAQTIQEIFSRRRKKREDDESFVKHFICVLCFIRIKPFRRCTKENIPESRLVDFGENLIAVRMMSVELFIIFMQFYFARCPAR